jgi:hypothetical protein
MFGLRIYGGPYSNVLTIGRPGCKEAPIYYMRKDGRPVMRWCKYGYTAEHGEGGKAKDKAEYRIGSKPWQAREADSAS